MFNGFSGMALNIFSMLKKEDVAYRVYRAMMFHEKEVFIPWHTYWSAIVMNILRPIIGENTRIQIIRILMGDGMKTLDLESDLRGKKNN